MYVFVAMTSDQALVAAVPRRGHSLELVWFAIDDHRGLVSIAIQANINSNAVPNLRGACSATDLMHVIRYRFLSQHASPSLCPPAPHAGDMRAPLRPRANSRSTTSASVSRGQSRSPTRWRRGRSRSRSWSSLTESASRLWSERNWVAQSSAVPFSSHQANKIFQPGSPFAQFIALSYLRLLCATALHLRLLSLE